MMVQVRAITQVVTFLVLIDVVWSRACIQAIIEQ
jgi:hypothetical protein